MDKLSFEDTIVTPADERGDVILITQINDEKQEFSQVLLTRSEAREVAVQLLELAKITLQ